jgi:hypothetical protein
MSTADPYAALARLPGSTFRKEVIPAYSSGDVYAPESTTLGIDTSIFSGDRAQFQSKYNWPEDLGDGRYALTFQAPGGHKYDTLRATYKLDPATGEYVMESAPVSTRQVSSSQNMRDAAEKGIPFVAAVLGGAYGLSQLAGAGATAGATGKSGLDAYMLTGASEMSTVGGAAAGGGGAGAVGSGSLASAIAAPMEAGLLSTGGAATAGPTAAGTTAATPTLASAASSAGPATMANTFGSTGMSGFGDWIQLGGLVNSIVNKPKAPDTSGLNEAARANAGIADRQQGLAEKQYADSLALFNEFKPFLVQQMQTSASEQQKSIQRSDDQWNSYLTTYRPIEQQMAEKSANWASEPRMRAEAERAGAEVQGQFDRARTTTSRNLSMAGASPEKIAALEAAGRLEEAKAVGGAQGETRRAVEKEGMAYLDNVARFGRGMPSTGLAAAGLAGSQGQQATGGYGTLANAQTMPAASASPLFNSAVSANSSAGNLSGAASNMAYEGALDQWGIDMGTFKGLSRLFGSSKKIKTVGGDVKAAGDKVERSGAKHWAYNDGQGDGNTKPRMGPIAEDLQREAPEVSNGRQVDAISMLGLHHAGIGEHNKAIRELKREVKALRRTLADVA